MLMIKLTLIGYDDNTITITNINTNPDTDTDRDIQLKIDDIIRKSELIQKTIPKIPVLDLNTNTNNFDVDRAFKKNLKKLKCLDGISNDIDDDELENLIGNLKNVSSRPSTSGDTGRITTGRMSTSLSSSSIALDDATRNAIIYSKSPRYVNDNYNDYSNNKMINNYNQRPRSSGGAVTRMAQNGLGIINSNNINSSIKNINNINYNNKYTTNNNDISNINDNDDTYSDYGL